MANTKEYRIKRNECEKMFISGRTDPKDLATVFGVRPSTVENWIRKYNWKSKEKQQRDIEAEIFEKADEALLVILQELIKNPKDKDLQSIKGLFKEFLERKKPARQYLSYIIRYQEQFKSFCLEKGYTDLWEEYRKVGSEFSEYLRVKNG